MENIEEIAEAITREVVSTDFIAEEDLPDAVNLNPIKDYLFKEFDGTNILNSLRLVNFLQFL